MPQPPLIVVGAGLFGLIIGSFIAAVTVRMPRDEDIVFTRSHCMSCEAPLKAWHLVPVVSWLVQRGRCAMCGAAVSPRYLLIDEMSLGLAPLIVKRLLAVVTQLKAQGVGILLIEQFTDLALSIAETAVVLRSGKMRYSGPAPALVADKTLLQNAYFGV